MSSSEISFQLPKSIGKVQIKAVSSVLLSKTCEKCFEWCFPSHLKIPRVNIAHNTCIVLLLAFCFRIKHPRVSLLISSLPSEIVVSVKWNLPSDVSFDKRNNFVTAFTWVEVLSTRKIEQRYIPVETMMSILRATSKVSMSKFYLELAHSITDNEQEDNLKFPFSLFFLSQKTKKRRRRMS